MEGVILFLVLFILARQPAVRARAGVLSGAFLVGYGLARIVGEQFREPEVALGTSITWGQWLSVPMVLVGAYVIWRARPIKPA
jgi:phosphatidylglycerol:prolipoprotein diacylglycerol transferase